MKKLGVLGVLFSMAILTISFSSSCQDAVVKHKLDEEYQIHFENSISNWNQSDGYLAPAQLQQEIKIENPRRDSLVVCIYDVIVPATLQMSVVPINNEGYKCFVINSSDSTILHVRPVVTGGWSDECLEFLKNVRPRMTVRKK